jgi:hypothetical protein
MCLYAEGFSMANYLVSISDRKTYLKFVADGMRSGWDNSVRAHYRFNSVEELEESWLAELRRTKRQQGTFLASNTKREGNASPTGRTVVRLTVPPAQPLDEQNRMPVYRGQNPAADAGNGRFADPERRPEYLPDYVQANPPASGPTDGWQPAARSQPYTPVRVELLPPVVRDPPAPAPRSQPVNPVSPVGYPR